MTKKQFATISLSLITLASLLAPASALAAQCSGKWASVPGVISAKPGMSKGEVVLSWNLSTNVDRYGLVYGWRSGKWAKDYNYGAQRVGGEKTASYMVKGLESGRKYYFRVVTACGPVESTNLSKEVSAVAK